MLNKEECLFERDEEGNLISKKITLELLKDRPEIVVRPLTRGKLMVTYQKAKDGTREEKVEADIEVIENGLVEPKLTREEIEVLKPNYAGAISTAILAISLGIEQKEVKKATDIVLEQESELKKNLKNKI